MICALALGRTITAFLFQVQPSDPFVLASVVGVLGAAGVLASYVPARRAARLDPALSLRAD
jgi:ABC-type antimicrobial peptide transport system permease subunit